MARMPDFEMPEPAASDAPGLVAQRAEAVAAPSAAEHDLAARAPIGRASGLRATWRRVRVPALAFVAGIVVAVAATVATGVVQDRAVRDDVVAALDAYLAAVESIDGRTAAAAATPAPDDDIASGELLQRAIPVAAPPDVVCDEPRIGGDLATVGCRVRVEGRIEPTRIDLERDGFGWSIARGLEVPVRIQSGALLVDAIAGVPIDEAIARGERAVWLLPGRYDVDVRTPAALVVERLDGLVVSASRGSVRWTSDTAATIDVDVQDAALAFVEACAAAPADGCPALQQRDPTARSEAYAVVGRLSPDDPYAMTYEVSIRRPVEQPSEYLVVTVRVDFGEDLDRYDVAVEPST